MAAGRALLSRRPLAAGVATSTCSEVVLVHQDDVVVDAELLFLNEGVEDFVEATVRSLRSGLSSAMRTRARGRSIGCNLVMTAANSAQTLAQREPCEQTAVAAAHA